MHATLYRASVLLALATLAPAQNDQRDTLDPSTQWVALRAAARHRHSDALPLARKALTSELPFLRHAAAIALGEIGTDRDVEGLLATLEDGQIDVREAALRSVTRLLKQRVNRAARSARKDAKARVGGEASPRNPANPKMDAVTVRLGSKNVSERWAALADLTQKPDRSYNPLVLQLMSDDDPFVRHAAVSYFGVSKDQSAVKPLIQALADKEPFVRDGAYLSLRKITGQTFAFDPHAEKLTREGQRKTWKQWAAKRKSK